MPSKSSRHLVKGIKCAVNAHVISFFTHNSCSTRWAAGSYAPWGRFPPHPPPSSSRHPGPGRTTERKKLNLVSNRETGRGRKFGERWERSPDPFERLSSTRMDPFMIIAGMGRINSSSESLQKKEKTWGKVFQEKKSSKYQIFYAQSPKILQWHSKRLVVLESSLWRYYHNYVP